VLSEHVESDQIRRDALVAAMTAIQPIAGLLLEAGVSFHDMMRLARRAYVDVAASRQRAAGSRPTISRIAAATGMSRPDVSEALSTPPIPTNANELAPRAGDRILSGWRSDPDFLRSDGTPKPLRYVEGDLSFATLVKRHGPDIPPRAMLKELVGSGHVVPVGDDLFEPAAIDPSRSETKAGAIVNFGPKMNALGSTLVKNIRSQNGEFLYECLSVASSVEPQMAARISRELERRCKTFSQAIDRYLIDQEAPSENSEESQCHSLGVIVAVVERAPEQAATSRRRRKK